PKNTRSSLICPAVVRVTFVSCRERKRRFTTPPARGRVRTCAPLRLPKHVESPSREGSGLRADSVRIPHRLRLVIASASLPPPLTRCLRGPQLLLPRCP